MEDKNFTALHMETATALWEIVLEMLQQGDIETKKNSSFFKYYLNTGIGQLRYDVVHKLSKHCQAVYDIISKKDTFDCSWDLEFIPVYLSTVEWNVNEGPQIKSVEDTVTELEQTF